MTESTHTVSSFILGEEIGSDDNDIRIEITAIDLPGNAIVAKVVKAQGYFSESRGGERGHPQDGFFVGMELFCESLGCSSWTTKEKSGKFPNIPWFALFIRKNGTKCFKHYR